MADDDSTHFSFEEIAIAIDRAIDFGWERAHKLHSTNGAPPEAHLIKREIASAVIAVMNEILVFEEVRS